MYRTAASLVLALTLPVSADVPAHGPVPASFSGETPLCNAAADAASCDGEGSAGHRPLQTLPLPVRGTMAAVDAQAFAGQSLSLLQSQAAARSAVARTGVNDPGKPGSKHRGLRSRQVEYRWHQSTKTLGWEQPDTVPCPQIHSVVPPVATIIAVLIILWAFRWWTGLCEPAAAACSIMLFLAFTLQLNYTVIIPDSYPLAHSIGESAAYSGQLIGIYKPGSCVGSFLTWMLLKTWPDIWRTHPRFLLSIGLITSIVGALLYTSLAYMAVAVDQRGQPSIMAPIFLVSRFVMGAGAGLVMQLTFVSVARLTQSDERPNQMARLQLSNTLGIAGGPFMDSVLQVLEFCPHGPLAFQAKGIFQVEMLVGGLLATCWCWPSLCAAEDFMRSGPPAATPAASKAGDSAGTAKAPLAEARGLVVEGGRGVAQRVVIMGSILMTTARAVSVAGVEAAAVILLQREYAWEESRVGISVGLTFLASIPLKMIYNIFQKRLSLVGWIRILAMIGLLGSWLFFITSSGVMLLVATTVVFPTMYLSDALGLGAMQQHYLPDGSWFDANHTMLWFNMTVNGAGHFFGPILARYCVERGGQQLFAWQQLSLCLIFWALFEGVVRPNYCMPSPEKEAEGAGRPRLGTM